jgi:GlcNAc-P-P-Und epimerase
MKVLITGSSGLIGQWICKTLNERSFSTVGLDLVRHDPSWEPNHFYPCDILDPHALGRVFDASCPDMVVHLAARVDLEEKKDLNGYAPNMDGVRNVLDCVRTHPCVKRIIVTSSQLVCRVGHVPQSDTEYCPDTLYGQSKVETENITREMQGGGKEWCLVRPTTVWGPKMSPHYRKMLDLIRRRRYFHCGHGPLYKSYAYAGNIAFQYCKLLLAPPERIQGKTFYLADYDPISLRAYTNGLAKAMGAPPIPTVPLPLARCLALMGDALNTIGLTAFPFNSFRLRNILTEYQFDLSQTKEVCGDLPFSFEDGIEATAKWFLDLRHGEKDSDDVLAKT